MPTGHEPLDQVGCCLLRDKCPQLLPRVRKEGIVCILLHVGGELLIVVLGKLVDVRDVELSADRDQLGEQRPPQEPNKSAVFLGLFDYQ